MSDIDDLIEDINEQVITGMPGGPDALRAILLDMATRIQTAQDTAEAASTGGVAPYSTPATISLDLYWRRGGYRGAFSSLADLQAAIPQNGYRGDFAMLAKGNDEPASIAIWDWEKTPQGWVETGPNPIIEGMIAAETARAEAAEAALADDLDDAIAGEAAARSAAIAAEAAARDSAISLAIANLIGSAPGALNALNELAAAIGNDPNFAATIAAQIGSKQPAAAILTAISGAINAQRLLGRITGTGAAEEVTASQVLDWISNTVGAIAFRDSAGWSALAPSTAGHVLRTNGPGAAPSWVSPAAGSGDMVAANNLNDVASKPAAFDNISTVAEVNVAAAATTDIGAAASGKVNITAGAAQIDSLGTAPSGKVRWFRFSTAVLLKNNANIILPGGADIAAQVGDVGYAISRGAGVWQVYSYVDGLTTLERARKKIPRAKRLEMYHDGAAWVVEKPDGSNLVTTGTTTQGLQEAITHACNNGLALFVTGEGIRNSSGTQPVYINCTTGIVMPAVQHMMFHLYNVTVNFTPAVTGTGWLFDSFMMLDFVLIGQIVYAGTGAAVVFSPVNPCPLDTWVTACTDSRIRITQIACVNGAALSTVATCLKIDPSVHSVINVDFEFLEYLGGAYAIDVVNAGASSSFENCRFTGNHVHQQAVGGIRVGASATNAAGLRQNVWNITSIKPNGAGSVGFDTWGSYDLICIGTVSNGEGPFGTGVRTRSTSTRNKIIPGQVVGHSTQNFDISGTANLILEDSGIPGSYLAANSVGLDRIAREGSAGQIVTSQGAGTNLAMYWPAHAAPGGRVSLATNTPFMKANVLAATSVFYTPALHNRIPVWNGTLWIHRSFSEMSVALDSNSADAGYHQAGKNFDLFVFMDGATLRLGTGPAWSSDTARGTGAGTTELARLNGFLVNAQSINLRYGAGGSIVNAVAANFATYVGTVRCSADGQSEVNFGGVAAGGTAGSILIWNAYNQDDFICFVGDSTDSWSYSTGAYRAANNSNGMRVSYVTGENRGKIDAAYIAGVNAGTTNPCVIAVGFDSTTSSQGLRGWVQAANIALQSTGRLSRDPGLGFHYVQAVEWGSTGATFSGDGGSPTTNQHGFFVSGKF